MMACYSFSYNFNSSNNNNYNNTNLNDTVRICDQYTYEVLRKFGEVAVWAIFAIELPAVCTAIYALFHLIKANHVTPVYIINLLLSDLILIISRPFFLHHIQASSIHLFFLSILSLIPEYSSFALPAVIFYFGYAANIGFMVCIALERYLLVVHPLWYQCHRTIKHSVLISLAVWVAASIFIAQQVIYVAFCMKYIFLLLNMVISMSILIVLPFAFLLFFFWATWRALSQSMLVSAAEKKRILGTLLLIMGNYTIFFIPNLIGPFTILHCMSTKMSADFFCIFWVLDGVCMLLVYLNPLMDTLLYIFVRNGPNDSLRGFPCCRKQTHMIREDTVESVSQGHRVTVMTVTSSILSTNVAQ